MIRKALVIGVDHYENLNVLTGCVNDANAVKKKLERHTDGSINFDTRVILGTGPTNVVERHRLKSAVKELFAGDGEVALFYFAGHGHIEATGGYLCAGDCRTGDDGLPISEIMTIANKSRIRNKIIILDSCHSGIAGDHPIHDDVAEISEGVTILTASTAEQYASEENGSGIFTNLFVNALAGEASNLVGDITPGGVYAHVDQSLGAWAQRPVFKTNVKGFVSLRKVKPPIEISDLRRIAEFFPGPGVPYQLGPEYEPERTGDESEKTLPKPDPNKTEIFAILQRYNRLNLLVPVDAPHMWHAAMQSKTVQLTALGEHYRRLADKGRI